MSDRYGFLLFYENSVQHSDRKTFSERDVCQKEGDKDASRSETASQAEEVVAADQSESTARPRQHTDLMARSHNKHVALPKSQQHN